MSRHNKRLSHDDVKSKIAALFAELGLDRRDWQVSIDYTKGALSGGRGVVVEVTHRPSQRRARLSKRAGTKAQARATALETVREAVAGLLRSV